MAKKYETVKALSLSTQLRVLRRVRKIITAVPTRLDMGHWGQRLTRQSMEFRADPPECGTVACLAGWIVLASQGRNKKDWWHFFGREKDLMKKTMKKYEMSVPDVAGELLDLDWDSRSAFQETDADVPFAVQWLDIRIREREATLASR